MESNESVAMDKTIESLDDQNYALGSVLPDDGWSPFGIAVPDLAMPVAIGVEGAIVDSLFSASYAEDWLKSIQITQEKLIGAASFFGERTASIDSALIGVAGLQGFQKDFIAAAMPKDFGAASLFGERTASIDSAVVGAAGLQGLPDDIMGAAMPKDFDAAYHFGEMTASMNSALLGAAGSQGLKEDIIGAAMPKDFGAAYHFGEMTVGIDSAVLGATGLQGFPDDIMGAAMPKDFDAAYHFGEMTASMNSALLGAVGLQGLKEDIIGAAMPKDFDAAYHFGEMAASVDSAVAWSAGIHGIQKELLGFGAQWIRHVKQAVVESSMAISNLYLEDHEHFRACSLKLAQRGWFYDPQMPMSLLWYLGDTIEESPEVADELLMQWFQERLDEIEEELIKACPRRALLLRSAFNAHRERDYNNSIPAFLKEADGMWYDLFGMNVFVAPARKSIVKTIEEKQPNGLVYSSLVPLLQSTLPLWMSESERRNWMKKHRTGSFPGLNRHEVVHGISVDYGTETNSLKAISFLNWRLLVEFLV